MNQHRIAKGRSQMEGVNAGYRNAVSPLLRPEGIGEKECNCGKKEYAFEH